MTNPLLIALTFDIEADIFDQSLLSDNIAQLDETQYFQGLVRGVPLLKTHMQSVYDSYGQAACATWFVRCDDQIESQTGQADYLLTRYTHLWESFLEDDDEIGFHAHLYEPVQGCWQQVVDDARNCSQLARSHSYYAKAGFNTVTSRIGEAYFSNAILKQLNALGIQADSTAMPDRVRVDEHRRIDWAGTLNRVYRPDFSDYRQPQIKPAYDSLLQVPFTMTPTRSDYDNAPLKRYLDLSFHERVFQPALSELVSELDLLVTVTHPSTVLSELNASDHGLLSFSMQAFINNLEAVMAACREQSRPFRFVTLQQAVSQGLVVEGTRTGPCTDCEMPESQVA